MRSRWNQRRLAPCRQNDTLHYQHFFRESLLPRKFRRAHSPQAVREMNRRNQFFINENAKVRGCERDMAYVDHQSESVMLPFLPLHVIMITL